MAYRGSCHCGRVKFEAEGTMTVALSCNCSICARKAALLWAIPRGAFRLLAVEGDLGRYTFNRHVLAHRFCKTCGIHTHGEDVAKGEGTSVYVNLRCVEDFDRAAVPVQHFDGRSV